MKKFTKIEAGYRISIKSWECDGDNANTKVLSELTKDVVQFYVALCNMHKSQNSSADTQTFGNMYEPSDTEIEAHQTALSVLVKQHQAAFVSIFAPWHIDEENVFNPDHMTDECQDLLYTIGLSCGDYYTRVFESILVEYIPVEIKIEDVTDQFVV